MSAIPTQIKAIIFDLDDTLYDCSGASFSINKKGPTLNSIEINNITLFPDVINSINKLRKIGYKLILVTAGNKDPQETKIKVLGLEKKFDEIFITNVSSGKEETFKKVLNKYSLKPGQVLCVGDKIKEEIMAGKTLGMYTALMKHGRHYHYHKSNTTDIPDIYIDNISDLLKH